MKRRFLILGIGFVLGFSSLLVPSTNKALAIQKNTQLEKEKEKVQDKKSDIHSEINDKKNEIEANQAEQSEVSSEIKRLDLAVEDTKAKIQEKNAQIKETKEEIEKVKKEIKDLEERIAKRDELLKDRMRSLQESGGMVNYLDVIIGAKSFNDFINRVSAVATFVQADKDIITSHQDDIALLEDKEKEVKGLLAAQTKQKAELDGLQETLNAQISEKNKQMAQLKVQEEEMHAELGALEDTEELLASQEKAIQKEIEAWNRRQKEIEEERKRQEANGGTYTPPVSGGLFIRPATGRITSEYGPRWGTFHFGFDIGKGGRDVVPVYAAAGGTVSRSRLESSYGNVIMLTHYINGKQMTTVYAHLDKRVVGLYDRVEQGQLIGYMGNTGDSTGPHLHFEIYEGPYSPEQYANGRTGPTNSVNPRKYIN
ncbi:murein hydrolase activator EnvC family protein [Ferdinandcohnia quinoae]|uniref:murein hydrolase activator EnvC family protein n=1 Tax=Fredinandcohnia quinoae TaxID=2918902 RepID=UPI0023DB0130|nr:peptidoglycan DD-metalloendopeptidase family protein [Fredinandcohnia sp. SECRCQ15]